MTDYIAYYRVSTQRQGQSGLGLDAQQKAVQGFLQTSDKIVAEYTEIESGKRSDRPELAKALAHAKSIGAVLLIAKLDRLARNLHFITGLQESKALFQAVDNPNANTLMVQLLAMIAEHEARMTSERTTVSLAAAKARGVKLGGFKWDKDAFVDYRKSVGQASADRAIEMFKTIPDYQNLSFNALANALNEAGHKTIRGNNWTAMQVSRTLARVA
ncbi:recombinase family protein [Agrobacterium tumefaciens]|uniref:recombinase family protein n=1 Tax=Agrobacterium TaxID=357 RepID=UPI00115E9F27|nr:MULTISPECIES: recombinase family protein [Agrobacterium]MDA5241028.1 recombinase family protein [Agrobacterium sp. MAFF310724]MDA5249740.1 recombinase family protein [Agrobacterium sp. MAFF210268]TRB12253.1 recombinase family protein [Agrobacterium tumefaciens]